MKKDKEKNISIILLKHIFFFLISSLFIKIAKILFLRVKIFHIIYIIK